VENLIYENLIFTEDRDNIKKQWDVFWPVFDHFHVFLKNKGLKAKTIGAKTNSVVVFLMNYLRFQKDIKAVNEISGEHIKKFMFNYYPNIFYNSTPDQQKKFKKAIMDFYMFLNKKGFVSKEQLKNIIDIS
jgi:hypothetical protein